MWNKVALWLPFSNVVLAEQPTQLDPDSHVKSPTITRNTNAAEVLCLINPFLQQTQQQTCNHHTHQLVSCGPSSPKPTPPVNTQDHNNNCIVLNLARTALTCCWCPTVTARCGPDGPMQEQNKSKFCLQTTNPLLISNINAVTSQARKMTSVTSNLGPQMLPIPCDSNTFDLPEINQVGLNSLIKTLLPLVLNQITRTSSNSVWCSCPSHWATGLHTIVQN